MKKMGLLLLLIVIIIITIQSSAVAAQSDDSQDQSSSVSFRPSVGIVMAIFGIMFTLTFLLLLYAKFCHTAAADLFATAVHFPDSSALDPPRRNSGVEKSVIESLPFFRFSALKGSREGLECAVCLSPFEATEVLRLLPNCKHAFHIGCVDRWLEGHSSCPLCRHKVDADFHISESSRWLVDDVGVDLELFIEREPSGRLASSSRFTIGSSFRTSTGADKNEDALLTTAADEGGGSGGEDQLLHKFKHRIIVSDVVLRSRWSDVNSSDLMSLNSDMLRVNSSKRFSVPDIEEAVVLKPRPSSDESVIKIKEEMDKKRAFESKVSMINRSCSVSATNADSRSATDGSRSVIAPGDRCMSEITNLSRFGVGFARHRWNSGNAKDDRVRRVWLPIARRTVRWFAGRERRSPVQHPRAAMIV